MIRKLIKEDIPSCARIFVNAFSEASWGCSWTEEKAEEYLTDYAQNPKFIGFVSENDGVIDGALFACEKMSWNANEVYVDEMFVAPKRQRSGIGKALADALKVYCKDKNLAGIVLYTAEAAPAKLFYEKNGFKVSDGVICMYWT